MIFSINSEEKLEKLDIKDARAKSEKPCSWWLERNTDDSPRNVLAIEHEEAASKLDHETADRAWARLRFDTTEKGRPGRRNKGRGRRAERWRVQVGQSQLEKSKADEAILSKSEISLLAQTNSAGTSGQQVELGPEPVKRDQASPIFHDTTQTIDCLSLFSIPSPTTEDVAQQQTKHHGSQTINSADWIAQEKAW